MKRTGKPLSIGAALDKLHAINVDRALALADARDAIRKRAKERASAIWSRVLEDQREALQKALDAVDDAAASEAEGDLVTFGTDPADSAALLEIRQIIDEIGWPTFEAEEAADYPARLRGLHRQRLALAKALADSKAGNIEGDQVIADVLEEIAREVNDPHPDPLPGDGARAVKPDGGRAPAEGPISDLDSNPPGTPRGVTPYEPGPAARAATGKR